MNASKLKEIAHSNPTAELMFTAWGLRERHRPVTDLRRFRTSLIQRGVKVNEDDFYKTFEQLALEGAGTLSHPIRGRPKYFHWALSVHEIAKAGLEGVQPTKVRVQKPKSPKSPRKRPLAQLAEQGPITVYIALPSGRMLPVTLPSGVSDPRDIAAIGNAFLFFAGGSK